VGCVVLNAMCTNPVMTRRRMPPVIDALRQEMPAKPLIFTMMGDDVEVPPEVIEGFRDLGVPFFRSPERALRALARVIEAAQRKRWPRREIGGSAAQQPLPRGVIPEHRAKAFLAQAGVPFPKGAFVADLAAAQRAVSELGFPVALKAQSPELSHKSDAGGVVLGISDAEALAVGWASLQASVARAHPGLTLDGILVEAMQPKGVELILGARNDPEWGAVLAVGIGGIFAEAMHDMRVLPADLAEDAIIEEILQLRGAKLLRGFRGAPSADVQAVADIAVKLGAFVTRHPEIAEVDLNPVVVYPEGKGAIALDALIVTR
jgi:acyl-CoA synthetase (NDP forming)